MKREKIFNTDRAKASTNGNGKYKPQAPVRVPVLIRASEIVAREIEWLWHNRIPAGRGVMLVGHQGFGKTFITCDFAARVSTGTAWPDGAQCPIGDVILISGEDDPRDTLRPRLEAHGANLDRVHILSMVRSTDASGKVSEFMFTLQDVNALEQALISVADCRLVVIDPIGSFIGSQTDSHRDNEVRGVLSPVVKLAEKYGPALLFVAHRRKASGALADDLALGSRAYTGISRAVWHLSRDPNDKNRRLLLPGKNNLAPEGTGLAFTIGGDPPALAWERNPVLMNANEAIAAEADSESDGTRFGPEPTARKAAVDWLAEVLAGGPVETATVRSECKDAGINYKTAQRAADELGVIREKNSFTKGWEWRLPRPGPQVDSPSGQPSLKGGHLSTCPDGENPKKNDALFVSGEHVDKSPSVRACAREENVPAPAPEVML